MCADRHIKHYSDSVHEREHAPIMKLLFTFYYAITRRSLSLHRHFRRVYFAQ